MRQAFDSLAHSDRYFSNHGTQDCKLYCAERSKFAKAARTAAKRVMVPSHNESEAIAGLLELTGN